MPLPEKRYSSVPARPSTTQAQTPSPVMFAEPSAWMTIRTSSVVVPARVPVKAAVRLSVRIVLPPAVRESVGVAVTSENVPLDGAGGLASAAAAASPRAVTATAESRRNMRITLLSSTA
jgi:hypothetical protein